MQTQKSIRWLGLGLVLILSAGCSKNSVYSFEISSRLKGGGKVSMTVDVEFADASGTRELAQKLETVKYAMYLVLSRKSAAEMERLGNQKTANSISRILLRHLEQKAGAVRVRRFHIEPRPG